MRCKPGDRAVIIGDPYFPSNCGVFVHVVMHKSEGGEDFVNCFGDWICDPCAPLMGFGTDENGEDVFLFKQMRCCIADKNLKPIRPPEQDTGAATNKELEAT